MIKALPTIALVVAIIPSAANADPDVVFTKDVAPILFKHCATCHRPGEIGPFSLLSYKDASKRAAHLAEVVSERRMPPWHAEPGPHRFLDDRRMSDEEVAVVQRWARTGAKEGDPKDLPPPPKFTDGWQLGKPDLIVKMSEPYSIPADQQVIRMFVMPIPIDQVKYVRGLEFRPGNTRTVHHAMIFLDSTGEMRKQAEKQGGSIKPRFGFEPPTLQSFPGLIGVWTPGYTARSLPNELAQALRPHVDLVLHIHYQPTGKVEKDQSSIGLFFAKEAGRKYAIPCPLAICKPFRNTELLNIPAGAKRHKVELTQTIPTDGHVYAVQAHAHYLLRDLKLTATAPGGKPVSLLHIPNWDFNWQDKYVFAAPPRFAKGTRLDLVAYFDNSADNPQNPNKPPKDVHFGESSTDEMLSTTIVLIPERETSVPAEGVVLPADAVMLRKKFDKDGDGKLSPEEIEALPPRMRLKVEEMAREGLKPVKAAVMQMPPGGYPLPPGSKLLREKYDLNKDGKLSQKEFEAIPQPLRTQVEEWIRRRSAAKPELLPTPREVTASTGPTRSEPARRPE